jgi:uncharacterized protein (DUF58 family)
MPKRALQLPRPTRSAALLVLLAVILELLGRLIDSTGVTVAAAAALGAVLGDAVLTPRTDGFVLRRRAMPRLTRGLPVTVRVIVELRQGVRVPRRPVVVIDTPAGLPVARVVVPALRPGEQAIAERVATAAHRGYWARGGGFTVEARSPLDGFVRRRTVDLARADEAPTWVHPAPARPFPLPPIRPGVTVGTAASGQSGPGTEFFGVREWRSGDTTSSVHWRATARRAQVVVIERERPAHPSLMIAIGPAPEDRDAWEIAIARVAATAVAAQRAGQTVTFVCGHQTGVPRSAVEILNWFAALDEPEPLQAAALSRGLRLAGSGANVLWLSASRPPAAMDSNRSTVVTALSGPAIDPGSQS